MNLIELMYIFLLELKVPVDSQLLWKPFWHHHDFLYSRLCKFLTIKFFFIRRQKILKYQGVQNLFCVTPWISHIQPPSSSASCSLLSKTYSTHDIWLPRKFTPWLCKNFSTRIIAEGKHILNNYLYFSYICIDWKVWHNLVAFVENSSLIRLTKYNLFLLSRCQGIFIR